MSLLEKRGSIKGSAFTHDEPSLQSPRNLSSAQNLPPMIPKDETSKIPDSSCLQKPRKISSEKPKNENNLISKPKDLLPPIQLPSTSTLGAINCLEELVKASTSTLCSSKDVKPTPKKQKPPAPQAPLQDSLGPLPPVFNPYFQPEIPPPQGYPMWHIDPHQPPVDFSAYYPPNYSHPYQEQWRPESNYFFQDSFNNYYSHFYPETKAQPSTQALLPLFPDPAPPPEDHTNHNQNFFGGQFNIQTLNPLPTFGEKESMDQSNNFSFLNVAHTLFGQ